MKKFKLSRAKNRIAKITESEQNQESYEQFDGEKDALLKPLLKTILREANQNPKFNRKSIKLFITVLQERFGYDLETVMKMKPYIMKLIDDLKSGKESL